MCFAALRVALGGERYNTMPVILTVARDVTHRAAQRSVNVKTTLEFDSHRLTV